MSYLFLSCTEQFIIEKKVSSIAIPALGAGNGGLNWQDVKPKIEFALSDLQDVEILIFEPIFTV